MIHPSRRGFTLIELLVVISIIGMLSSIVLVSLQSARDKGKIGAALTFSNHIRGALYDPSYTGNILPVSYSFNEASGNAKSDFTNNDILLPVSATTPTRVSGGTNTPTGSGSSLFFDGGDLAQFTTDVVFPTDFTIAFWVKAAPAANYMTIFSRNNAFGVFLNNNNLGTLYISSAVSGGVLLSNGIVADNKWHHVAWSRTGAPTNVSSIYIDGKIDRANVAYTPGLTGGGPSFLGQYNSLYPLTGYVDDFRIFTKKLSASEIESMYAQGASDRGLALE